MLQTVIFMGYVLRAGGQSHLIAKTRKPSEVHVNRFKHQEVSHEAAPSFPCAGGTLKIFDLPHPHRGEKPVEEDPMPDEEEKEKEPRFEEDEENKSGAGVGTFFP